MITRTIYVAEVKATVVEKTENGIQQRDVEVSIEKCTSTEKAEIALSKMFKNAIVEVKECVVYADKMIMEDSAFRKNAILQEHKALSQEEIAVLKETRKRGK